MKAKTTGKSVTILVALLIVLSGTLVLHWNVRAEGRIEGSIEGIIHADNGKIPAGFEVQLKELSQDEIINTVSQEGGYFQFSDVDVGWYQIIVPAQTHSRRAYFYESTDEFKVEANQNIFHDIEVEVRLLEHKISGNVTDAFDEPVADAMITLSDGDNYQSSVGVEMMDNGTRAYYKIWAYTGQFDIKVEADGFAPQLMYGHDIDDHEVMDFQLGDSPMVSGYLWTDTDGQEKAVTTEAEVTLINKANGDILRNTMPEGNPWFSIGATDGEFILVVSAHGYMPYIHDEIEIVGGANIGLGRQFVNASAEEDIITEIKMVDWNTIEVTRERTLHSNSRMMGMDHWYLGNLPMQIDTVFGNSDGELNQTELTAFKDWLEYREANILSTQGMFYVNGVAYELDGFTFDTDALDVLIGDVLDESMDMVVESMVTYTAEVEVEEENIIDLFVMHDSVIGNHRDYTYSLVLPEGYKRVSSDNEVIPADVSVSGHLTIDIDPDVGEGRSHVSFDVRGIETGDVVVSMDEGPYAYRMDNETYIVKQGVEVTFMAEFWHPYGEDAVNYTWSVDKYGDEIIHVFDNEGEFTVSVTVLDTAGLPVTNSTKVIVDGSGPTGDIVADNTTVDEGQPVEFSAYYFEDISDIRDYDWNFSDGNHARGVNVTHSFDLFGTYEVTLNITDRLGNWNEESITITVRDATDPVARFAVRYDDVVQESENITVLRIERNQQITLDASKSYDPAGFDGVKGPVSVWWWISGIDYGSDDVILENRTFFTTVGTYRITLNVTDARGNYHNISRTVEVTPGPTPNLEITEIMLSEDDVVVNRAVRVIANVTNYGTANATNVVVNFRVDGSVKTISPRFYTTMREEAANNNIPMGEYRLIKFDWTPGDEGTRTLTVNVTDEMEPPTWQYDNEMDLRVEVNPPAWRTYVGYIVLPVVIILVTVGMYFYKDKIQAMLKKKED